MPKTEEQEDTTKDDAEDSSTKAGEDSTEEGDAEDLVWGFGFDEKKETADASKDEETDKEKEEPSDVDALKNEVKALKTQARITKELDALSKKYKGKEGFPDVDGEKIIGFLEKEFQSISPMELGYIFSGFNDILNAQKTLGVNSAKDKYSPEAIKDSKKKKYAENLNNRFAVAKERLQKRFLPKKAE